jgi:acyl-CoA thioesterase
MPQQDRMADRGDAQRMQVESFNRSEMARLLGMECTEAYPGFSRVVMETNGKRGPGGTAHGGAIFALADQAFGIAANLEERHQVALSAHITYISPATGRLEAVAERVTGNELNSVYRVAVNEGGRMVALFDGVGICVPSLPNGNDKR